MIRISCDIHTHTLFSRHAYSTVEEDVWAAADQDFELLGVTDHFSDMLFEEQTLKNFQFFTNLDVWPRSWHGVRLLRGCEVDIVDGQGNLFGHDVRVDRQISDTPMRERSLKELVFDHCDYAIASVHNRTFTRDASPAQNAQMYIHALEDPKVLVLGHVGRSHVDFELDPVLEAARDMGKLIEINESSLAGHNRERSLEPCTHVAERCAELGCKVSFGSDAHICTDVGRHLQVKRLLESIDFPQELVACSDAEALLGAMGHAGFVVSA